MALIGLVALLSADRSARLVQQEQHKNHLEKNTRLVQSRLTTAIQIPLNTVASMQAFMLAGPTLPSYDSFDKFASNMLRRTPAVGGFAYVDADQVIRHFYPLKGNEKAIGLDLKTRPAAPYVAKAIRQNRLVMSPPVVTVQGHLSTIARMPLFRDGKLLGLVQGVIDIHKTLQLALKDLGSDVHVSIKDKSGHLFWGPTQIPRQFRRIKIKLGDGYWHARVWLDAGDSSNFNGTRLELWLIGGALLLSLLFIVNSSFTERQRLTKAVQLKTAQLAANEARWRSLLEQVNLMGIGLDKTGCISYVNPYFCNITGFDAKEVIGRNWFEDFLPAGIQKQLNNVFDMLKAGETTSQHLNPVLTKSGEERIVSWFNARVLDEKGEFDGSISIGEDITARQEMEKRLDYLAYHDTLTGLPNRTLFLDRLEHAVKRAQRDNTLLALLVVDLDQFKTVNDSLGHFVGDLLLQEIAQRFGNAVRSADTVARIGGDEFTVLLENIHHVSVVEDVANNLLKELAQPIELEKNKLYISASIGIVLYPMADDEIEDLLRAADTAMYYAKADGRNGFRFYQASMSAIVHNQLNLGTNLHDALENKDFSLVFQPIVDIKTNIVTGYEALLRWHQAGQGWVAPTDFIPVAESSGLIVQIGYWVLRQACRSFNVLKDQAKSEISMSVNVSGHQFRDNNFLANFRDILDEEGMAAQNLVIEVTESQLMEETQVALQVLHGLRDMGCRIAIDDFGTGYSSLSYLRMFPVDVFKVDRSFIADLATDQNSIALMNSILMIADSLHIEVIAEGVETQEQIDILKRLGLQSAQGYYLGKPTPLDSSSI